MNLKRLLSKQTFNHLSRLRISSQFSIFCNAASISATSASSSLLLNATCSSPIRLYNNKKCCFHSVPEAKPTTGISIANPEIHSNDPEEDAHGGDDDTMNEFLSRFVYIMRGELNQAYPGCDKQTIDGMLLIIVEKVIAEMEKGSLEHKLSEVSAIPSQDFSDDLWKTVWEVSIKVCEDMEKERKKEKMKKFLQSEDVKVMTRFASEVGIRGDMLRELRFKWAREKMEESEFYESLERLGEEEKAAKHGEGEVEFEESVDVGDAGVAGEKQKVVGLPKRHGKMKYKIYGLDLSDPKWVEVADKVNEAEEMIWPQEPKLITGKCKLVTEKIVSLKEENDPTPLLAEWVELVQPSRVDWTNLLEKLKQQNNGIYNKVAEHVLSEPSFEANIRDFSKLIDLHAKENRMEDAERVLKKMNENGMRPDILTLIVLVRMHNKAGNHERAKEAFERLQTQGFKPDMQVYTSMIMAHVNAGQPLLAEQLMREMELRDIKPTKEIYMALLQSFAERGDVKGAQRIDTTMQFAGFQPSLESCSLLVEAQGRAGDPDMARNSFDYMMKLGHKPDDKCTASMIAAYEKKNLLDKALELLLQLEKDGFEPGVSTYIVLVDWFGKLQLVDEVEQILGKIAMHGESPSIKLQVSLCEMYSRAGIEKKALQALGVLEAKKEQLGQEDFERIVNALIAGRFDQEARRIYKVMEEQGFASDPLKVAMMAPRPFDARNSKRRGLR